MGRRDSDQRLDRSPATVLVAGRKLLDLWKPEYAEDLMGQLNSTGRPSRELAFPVPKATWSEEFKREEFWFHPAKTEKVCEFVGKTNETAYRLFPAGSLLILSIEGSFGRLTSSSIA